MSDRTIPCDICDTQVAWADKWVVRLPRPSDPHDWTAIMWLCPPCGADNGAKTEAGWDRWIESDEGLDAGAWWLS